MDSECLITFLPRKRFFHVFVARLADALNFTNFGWHRDGSGNGRPLGRLRAFAKPRRRQTALRGQARSTLAG